MSNRSTAIVVSLGICLFGVGSCKKGAREASGPGREISAPAGSMDRAAARPTAARRAAPPRSAQGACPKGARPGHAVERDAYRLTVSVPAAAQVGQEVAAEITVVPKSGYKVNEKYPAELTIRSAEGLSVPRKTFDKAKAAVLTKAKLVFRVPAKPTAAGRHVVRADLGFSVCTPKLCLTEPDMCVAWEIQAK